ncbi:hypothetical protein PLEOSDRAFT_1036229 [Pleurotus ostreatus PC15]|uniref:PPIase cyclophilin-type domain-containing protein n=1 Tax=Pleurotus ostreatus (strain PC15) TaxID=1137138 RepID=A0A067NS63_PLEO1|nr:hypothetical protein PLEOSDRAFT_1036229 [Pleurotus ostreatus PC15]
MGHGNSDKLYITHAEHAGYFGNHSASAGYRASCIFDSSICNTGSRFIYRQHNNTNPITKEPLTPDDLIHLHYSRKEASGEIHDPISFKPFSEHSHIVAIATTGNVFLAESIKGNRDLVADVPFKKQDVITLQNPHGLPPLSVDNSAASSAKKQSTQAAPTKTVVTQSAAASTTNKTPVPCSGLPGASLTSTSVDPQISSSSSKLLWDEEELMFEDIANPLKGKGKEKDVGKRRAYVRIVTSLGSGSLNLELFCEKAPKTCYNFLMLARAGKYDNCLFHRLVPGFMIQTGDPTGTGAGGESHWGTPFRDEHDLKNAAKHDSRGVVAMANKGAGTNGSQFYVTFKATPNLDKKHTVFGKLVGGEDVLDALEKLPLKDGTERPAKAVRITEVVIYQDPFEDYKKRLAKKLAKRAESEQAGDKRTQKREGDDINWFGIKVGADGKAGGPGGVGGGVGKYLNTAKRPLGGGLADIGGDDAKKKRKIGFGDFEGW